MASIHMDRQTFLSHLRKSGLLSEEQLALVLAKLPETQRGKVVARTLVERGLLTKFQAELLLAGRTNGFILGQYRILDQLGQGGMGRVFKAIHQAMNRVVALKLVSASLIKTERGKQMFQREVRAAAQLLHPNIVTAYDANQVGDRHYLVMELVDGPNLEQLVRDRGPLSIGQACDFIRQAAMGLQYASEMGMVHRDIKPANLLVQRAGGEGRNRNCVIKILDFGLARLQATDGIGEPGHGSIVVRQNVVMGTPDYLSPEQARDLHKADIRSDLYSLGCTFYFLLTGQVPFPGGTTMEKLVRHSTEQAVPVEKLRADIPPVIGAIVRRLLSKDPAARFQTPTELAATLAPYSVAGPTSWHEEGKIFVDLLATPPHASEAGAEPVEKTDCDEDCALIGTLSPDASATPISATDFASMRLHRTVQEEQNRRLWLALGAAVAIVASLVGLGGWLLW